MTAPSHCTRACWALRTAFQPLLMDEDAQLRQALEESLKTAMVDDDRSAHEPSVPTAPLLTEAAGTAAEGFQEPVSDFERQRQEAVRQQAARWQQLHGQQESGLRVQQHQQPPSASLPQPTGLYPSVPAPNAPAGNAAVTGMYPRVPRYSDNSPAGVPESGLSAPTRGSTQQQQHAVYEDAAELRSRQQQEEEDHRLAMQLAAQFEAEDSEEEQMHLDEAAAGAPEDVPHALGRFGISEGDDSDWQQVNRTPSMQRATGAAAAAGPAAAEDGIDSSSRPSSQTAAAAGSAAGSMLGAGVAALLAMAANAAARRAQQSQEASAHADASSGGSQQSHQDASSGFGSDGNRQQRSDANESAGDRTAAAESAGGSSSHGSGIQGMLGMAANALWNYMTGRQNSSSSSTATATTSSSSSSRSQQQRHQQQAASGDEDMAMLQQLMQHMMTGGAPPRHQQAGSSGGRGAGQGGGFRVVNLPGGGFAATYSSNSSSGNRPQYHASEAAAAGDPFGMMMDPTEDLFTQLLLAGARSARSNHHRQQGLGSRDPMEPGFAHFDPATGFSRFEPVNQVFGPGFMGLGLRGGPDQGLEALIGALLGGQGLEGIQFGGPGGMRYEDLVNLDNVHVSTPDEILADLPRSKFVEGRKPGDSDTCVICQTEYSPGDSLIHLPCLHAFHEECITPWLQGHSKKCPVCKTDVC